MQVATIVTQQAIVIGQGSQKCLEFEAAITTWVVVGQAMKKLLPKNCFRLAITTVVDQALNQSFRNNLILRPDYFEVSVVELEVEPKHSSQKTTLSFDSFVAVKVTKYPSP